MTFDGRAGSTVADWFDPVTAQLGRALTAHPDRAAVQTRQGLLTYAELDVRADDIAAALQRSGAGRGVAVAVLAPDPRELMAALLGLLRAGGVGAVLDPAAPTARTAAAVHDLQPEHVLLGADTRPDLPAVLARYVRESVRLPIGDTAGASAVLGPVAGPVLPEDPCTVVLRPGPLRPRTSVTRFGALALGLARAAALTGAEPGLRHGLLAPTPSPTVARELFLPLVTGGTACIAAPTITGAEALSSWVDRVDPDVLHVHQPVLRALLEVRSRAPERLRCLAVLGRGLDPQDVALLRATWGGRMRVAQLDG